MIKILKNFKKKWEISKNWQLLFPTVGIFGSFIFCRTYILKLPIEIYLIKEILSLFSTLIFIKICVIFIKKLENKWIVKERWELIRIFIIFGVTGSSSALVGRPLMNLSGFSTENLNIYAYWLIYIFVSLLLYQVLLMFWAYFLGQFQFFWEFEKKLLKRIGFKKYF